MVGSKTYRHNHYVPIWYQERFMRPGQGKYHYLDLRPEVCANQGHRYTRRALREMGPVSCFAQDDLYTTKWGTIENTEIEQFFFGNLDTVGKSALEYFSSFAPPDADGKAYQDFVTYMTVQKLRTPKGLGWLAQVSNEKNHNLNLLFLQSVQNIFGAIWTECVWQLADAKQSPTKFIISDHPVVVYNRRCFPGSNWCIGFNDPDIRYAASHTYFPLSLDRVLIMTNLNWVRNPYQKEMTFRPNPKFQRPSIFKFTDIQTHRELTEEEVLQINYITKKRAFRYIAAAEKEWLYPEARLTSAAWNKLGDGLLLMPEPREVHMGGEIMIGYGGGRVDSFGDYGQKPWDKDPDKDRRFAEESRALRRFQAEFSARFGRTYRGTTFQFGPRETVPYVETEEMHAHLAEMNRRLNGVSRRRAGARRTR